MLFEDFHFLRPWWLLGLIPMVVIAWVWIKRTQVGSGWETTIDNELLTVLLDGAHKRSNRLLSGMLALTLACASFGLAGPTWQKLPQSVEQKNDALVIVLDLSLSMLAEDIKPSRIERARQKVTDILRLREEGQTALIVYAGDAHAVVPLTDDVATISNLLVSLSPEMMPVFGSNPDHGLSLAFELFDNSFVQQGRILMITDGIDSINSVSQHRSRAFPISILGIGTSDGAPIPLDRVRQPGRTLRTQEGNEVIALLDTERLTEVAQLTFGNYQTASLGDTDILNLLSTVLPGEDQTIDVEREFDTWFDQGHWAALLVIPMLLLAFRKGVFLCVLLAFFVPSPAAHANAVTDLWDSLWMRDDQRGLAALRYGEPEKAATIFSDPQWQSVAQYRSANYGSALQGFAADESLTGRYNEANSLARLGEYQAAITSYDTVLAQDPEHEDAAFNKALVERLLEEQQQAEQQQNQDQQNQANNENSDSEQDQQQQQQDQSQQDQESEQSEQEQEQAESEQTEQQQGEEQSAEAEQDDASRDEKQEALEQWLRRVPDDPGGLLRRKFSHETKQRLRRGEYENRQGEKLW